MAVCFGARISKDISRELYSFGNNRGNSLSLDFPSPAQLTFGSAPPRNPQLCTTQACAFRDSYEKFKKAGAEVVGISGDGSASHKAFAEKYKLPYTLLSDEGNKVRKEWGVPSDLFGALPGRQTYVLDKNGVCRLVYNNQFQPEKHIDETLKFLKSV
ncbi:peroxiredoxin q chloroplastic [Phtheirospermum japonicum]|uniref:Peroxiredoxin Q, chloroplastic n=1 Tax=Phtheirospermum japonicum TaxID=374723 RepID=A0A830BLL6_9LAMI|nr:peroxiredoxin q chloroplastic [Phtheirospermum japonicum]